MSKNLNLEIPVKVQSRLSMVVPFDRLGFLLVFYSNLSVRCTVFEIFDFKHAVTVKTGLWVRQGH